MTRLRSRKYTASFGAPGPNRSRQSTAGSGAGGPRFGRAYPAAALAILFLALHLPFLPASLEDLDSINFALGVRHFDVAHHQPHPPGYPLFVLAGKAAHVVVSSEADALALVGIVSATLGILALVVLFRRLDGESHAQPYAAALVAAASPLYWFTAARPLSDATGLAAALGVQALTLSTSNGAALIAAALLAGVATGIRSQVAWLTVPLIAFVVSGWPRPERMRVAASTLAAFVVGGLLWGIPLVVLTGGPAKYWQALSNQGAEDFSGVTMLWTSPMPRELLSALYYAFVAPWALWPLAAAVLVFAIVGLVRLSRARSRALTMLAWAFVPYLIFDLLFQETFTTRYALPLVVPIAYLAVQGLGVLPDRQALTLAAGLAGCSLAVAMPQLAAYSRIDAPAFRMLADMENGERRAKALAERPGSTAPVLAMHRREELDFRRPIQWVGDAMPRVAAHLPAPPKHEWLELVKYWNSGGRDPVWFVADPLRSDLALIDHESPRGSYDWPMTAPVLIGGVRPNQMDWYAIDAPSWYLGEGWALTPETAGVAAEDHRGPGAAPVRGWIRRRPEAAVLMIGGRNMTPSASHLRVSIDGRTIDDRDVAPGSFLQMLDLPPGALAGAGGYAALLAATTSDRTAIEQFDVQSAGRVVFGFGEGWHEHEYNPATGRQWRWTSERAVLRIRAGGHALGLVLHGETERSGRSRITVRIGDRILAQEDVGARLDLSIGIPAELVSARETILTIESDQTHVPAERSWRGNPDRRRLGLRVYDCRIIPAS